MVGLRVASKPTVYRFFDEHCPPIVDENRGTFLQNDKSQMPDFK